jgi:hypothetical protein
VAVVDTECTGTECDDLQQATCHHDVLEKINHLVLVRKVAMECRRGDEREQRKHRSDSASLESGNEQKTAAQLDRDGNGKSQGREGQTHRTNRFSGRPNGPSLLSPLIAKGSPINRRPAKGT